MKALKKLGWFIVSMLPAVLSLILQAGCAIAFLVAYVLLEGANMQEGADLFAEILYYYLGHAIYAVVLYQVVGVLVFGIWYYFAYGRQKRNPLIERPNAQKMAAVVWLGVGIQIFTAAALNLIYTLYPELLQIYIELMEAAGITDFTLITFIATVVLAPIGEELLCRGIIFRIAGKVSSHFWVANCIQALAFGIIHGNLVQGMYAFLMGLALGYIYGKYHNIWICMLLHGIINFTSSFTGYYFALFPENHEILVLIGNMVVSLLLMVFCFKTLGKRKL